MIFDIKTQSPTRSPLEDLDVLQDKDGEANVA